MSDLIATLEMAVAHYGFALPDTFEVTLVDEVKQTFTVREGQFYTEFDYYINTREEVITIEERASYSVDE